MIFWTRWGIVVPVLFVLPVILSESLSLKSYLGKTGSGLFVLLTASVLYWFLGKQMNKNSKVLATDQKTGQEIVINNAHTFMFIRVEYWSFITLALALYMLVRVFL